MHQFPEKKWGYGLDDELNGVWGIVPMRKGFSGTNEEVLCGDHCVAIWLMMSPCLSLICFMLCGYTCYECWEIGMEKIMLIEGTLGVKLRYKEIAIHGKSSRHDSVTHPLQYLLNVSGGLITKISDKVTIKSKWYLSNIFHISLSSTFLIAQIIKWERISKKIF